MDVVMPRIVLPAALIALACGIGACSPATTASSSLAAASYHPKYLPAADVIASRTKSGTFGGATYVCGDRDCATAVRAD